MKKSFMTRALATGLSLAMAFSLSAATNVTVASAASTPAMASKQFAVRVGGATKTYKASAATLKKFKITKATVGNSSKATVKVAASKKGIKVTPGTVTGSTVVKVTFKNSKTKKTTSKKYRCVVKAEKKPVEEAYKINSATATGVKTITVELNKAVADATKITKVDVKKGTAARESKFTVDGSKIVIAMDAKLTAGAYNVTIEGLEATALTADVTVEKDETLTSFEIADYITAKSATETSIGYIKYAALNQYGEKMMSSEPTVTCSFGKVDGQKPKKAATATAEGIIEVKEISPMLAIIGTKGTVVLVGDMGITATKEISYNSAATASTVEIAGTYHKNTASLKGIVEGDTIADYELLLTAKDQYGYAVDAADFNVNITLAGGLTNLAANVTMNGTTPVFQTRTVNNVDYIAIPLTGGKALAGDATLTIVNPYKGLLTTTTISVSKNVVLKSLNITADNGVYENQDNELSYEAIDAEGKYVTNYATLSNLLNFTQTNAAGQKIRLEKKSDGSAKMIYNPGAGVVPRQANTDKASVPQVITITANSQIGGDYLVKTFSFTVYQERVAKGVTGVAADQTTSISSKSTKNLEIPSTKIVLADQYSNKVVDGDKAFNKNIFKNTVAQGASGTAIYVAENGAVTSNITNNKIVFTPKQVGTATVYLKYSDGTNAVTASASNYDARFTVSVFDTAGVDTNTLEIKSVNDGFTVNADDVDSLTASKIKVVAKIGGTETVIPEDQYVIVKNENCNFTADEKKNKVTKTAKITVQVTTWDSNNNDISTQISKEYEVSAADPKLFKVTSVINAKVSTTSAINGVINKDSFVNNFKFKDQYGAGDTTVSDLALSNADQKTVSYKIELISASDRTGYTISANGTNSANVKFTKAGTYKLKITATTLDGSSKDYTIDVSVS